MSLKYKNEASTAKQRACSHVPARPALLVALTFGLCRLHRQDANILVLQRAMALIVNKSRLQITGTLQRDVARVLALLLHLHLKRDVAELEGLANASLELAERDGLENCNNSGKRLWRG
jgi:hypothetical protein